MIASGESEAGVQEVAEVGVIRDEREVMIDARLRDQAIGDAGP